MARCSTTSPSPASATGGPAKILRIGDAALQFTATALDAAGILRQHLPLVTRQSQDYAIGAEVARGGMGTVLQARESATRSSSPASP